MKKIPMYLSLLLPLAGAKAQWQGMTDYRSNATQYALAMAEIDANRDGLTDVLTGGYAGEKLKLHLAQGEDKYSTRILQTSAAEIQDLLVGDWNSDGIQDFICGGRPAELFTGKGDGTFERTELHKDHAVQWRSLDMDADGDEDLVCAVSGTQIVLLLNNGKGKFDAQAIVKTEECYFLNTVQMNDKDGTKLMYMDKSAAWLLSRPEGSEEFAQTLLFKKTSNYSHGAPQIMRRGAGKAPVIVSTLPQERLLEVYEAQSNGTFTRTATVNIKEYPNMVFATDLNEDGMDDLILCGTKGELSFLVQTPDMAQWRPTPIMACMDDYSRFVRVKSVENRTLCLMNNSQKNWGYYHLPLPEFSEWTAPGRQDPLSIIPEPARDAIRSSLSLIFKLDPTQADLFVYALPGQRGYGVFIENQLFNFDAKGLAKAPHPDLDGKTHYHPLQGQKLNPLDLEADLKENANKAKAKQSYAYGTTMLQEYLDRFFPKQKYSWSTGKGFAYWGTRINEKTLNREFLYVDWCNWSDGLEWNMWDEHLTRSPEGRDAYGIIEKKSAAEAIKDYLSNRYNEKKLQTADVFLHQSRSFVVGQRTSNLGFPKGDEAVKRYGVFLQGRVYFFDLDGRFLERTEH